MKRNNLMHAKLFAIIAACLFGATTPFSKLLLSQIHPLVLVGLFGLGSGAVMLIIRLLQVGLFHTERIKVELSKYYWLWLFGAMLTGGILAPVVLVYSLPRTSAATASILLNFESVSTTLFAAYLFKEKIGPRIWLAIILITVASILLSVDWSSSWGISLSALGVLLSTVFWGLDNNFTRNISMKDPYSIVIVRGLVSGSSVLCFSIILGMPFPSSIYLVAAIMWGGLVYGIGLVLFILAIRDLGASRASALLGTAPFLGALFSFFVFWELPAMQFVIALPFMVAGAYILLKEKHIAL
ncbi:MAG: EamA/RhaT family transporter [Candidatus Margulisiibacteriota bacterium]|nr:MAG: EamA/RhaT family transporter [Candidatus Margulisiibacteriota bacterium]HCY36647.1 EamA family transporter [Candidatus Margulisiibacteriota bacterium]